jgi:arylsulfatase A-like enzyme
VPFNAVHSPHQVPDKYMEPYANLKGERRNYAGMLAAMDEAIGQIVDAVDKAGVRKKTLFVFSSDNGGPSPGTITDNGKYRAGKGTLYEGGVRVAAFAAWEGKIPAGGPVAEALHMVDWYPTLLKLAGAKVEQKLPLDGLDAWPTIAEGKPTPHECILLNTTPTSAAVRVGDWKLVIVSGVDDPDGGAKPGKQTVELFNLKDDPFEKKNVTLENFDKFKELAAHIVKYEKQAVAPKAAPKPKGFVSPKVWGE